MSARDVIRQLLTESDNVTHDLFRYLAVGLVVAGVVLQGVALYYGRTFSMQDFGIGSGALLAGVGVALGLKKETTNE